mgnify:CR=1 FL=1
MKHRPLPPRPNGVGARPSPLERLARAAAGDEHLRGARLLGTRRRGKYLLLAFADGWLIVHLGMSGTLRYLPVPEPVLPFWQMLSKL